MGSVVKSLNPPAAPRALHGAQPAELQGLVRTARLRNGALVTVRPLLPADLALERDFVEHLSPESRYLRLFVAVPKLSDELLDRLMRVDYQQAMALMATVKEQDAEREIGIARYCVKPGTRTAEFAIVVADDWRGSGLACTLMEALIEAARKVHHLERLEGITLAENTRMLGLARALGFRAEHDPGDAQTIRLARDL